jgi:hypothetical protein
MAFVLGSDLLNSVCKFFILSPALHCQICKLLSSCASPSAHLLTYQLIRHVVLRIWVSDFSCTSFDNSCRLLFAEMNSCPVWPLTSCSNLESARAWVRNFSLRPFQTTLSIFDFHPLHLQPTRGGPPAWVLGVGLTTPHHENYLVT